MASPAFQGDRVRDAYENKLGHTASTGVPNVSIPSQCRLHLAFARDVPIAAVIRRGPSKRFHIIRWDYERDQFDHGSWFSGRIYEEASTLSPDGRWLYYFAANYSQKTREQLGGYAWAAVSELPWLKALWIQSCWGADRSRVRFVTPDQTDYGTAMDAPGLPAPYRLASEFPYVADETVPDADWCGRDLWNRVVFSRGGRLFRISPAGEPELIADFTDLSPPPRPI